MQMRLLASSLWHVASAWRCAGLPAAVLASSTPATVAHAAAAAHGGTSTSIIITSSSSSSSSYERAHRRRYATASDHHQQQQQQQQQQSQPQQRARVLDGRAVADAWERELAAEAAEIRAACGRRPSLAVVLVGDRPDSCLYVARKAEAAARAGIDCAVKRLPAAVTQAGLCAAVAALCADPGIDGVIVQLPLPGHLDAEAVMCSGALDPRKDVDGLHPANLGRTLMRGSARGFVPATPLGVMELLARSGLDVAGRSAVVLGDSNVVGTPLSCLLRDRGAGAVTVCHRVSLSDFFEADQEAVPRRRAGARACLPQLPGAAEASRGAAAAAAASTSSSGASGDSSSSSNGVSGGAALTAGQFEARHHLPDITRTADFLVVAVGSPNLVRASWIKPGAVVVDVGINVVPAPVRGDGGGGGGGHDAQQQQEGEVEQGYGAQSGRYATSSSFAGAPAAAAPASQQQQQQHEQQPLSAAGLPSGYAVCGDVAFDEASSVASALTPVPGGVGPMTIAALLANTCRAARHGAGLLPWWPEGVVAK